MAAKIARDLCAAALPVFHACFCRCDLGTYDAHKEGKADAPELSALLLKHSLLEQASQRLSSAAEPLALQPLPCPLPEYKTHVGPVPCHVIQGLFDLC